MADFQDEVKHTESGYVGIVIATYTIDEVAYFDVRIDDNHIEYKTPAAFWETTVLAEDLE